MRKIALGLVFGLVAIALAGTAAGLYLASRDGGTDNEQRVVEAQQTPTPGRVPTSPTATGQRTLTPTPVTEPSPYPIPTVGPPGPEGPPATATPTPEFGVCPPPVRQTPEDIEKQPGAPSVMEAPGWEPAETGTSFAAGYVTLHLPAGRQFMIRKGSGSLEGGLDVEIYDIQAESNLFIRGDGCEVRRLVADPAADLVFDEIMATLEVAATYVCPEPYRTTPADYGPEAETPGSLAEVVGERVEGGQTVQYGSASFYLPEGRQFITGVGVGGPGPFYRIYDVETDSVLFIDPPGCEAGRFIRDPAADAVFDQIVATLEMGD